MSEYISKYRLKFKDNVLLCSTIYNIQSLLLYTDIYIIFNLLYVLGGHSIVPIPVGSSPGGAPLGGPTLPHPGISPLGLPPGHPGHHGHPGHPGHQWLPNHRMPSHLPLPMDREPMMM